MASNIEICFLISSLFGLTAEAFVPTTLFLTRIPSSDRRFNGDSGVVRLPPKQSITGVALSTALHQETIADDNDNDKSSFFWKRIAISKPKSDSRFLGRIQRILPALGVVLFLFPLKTAASDTTMLMSPLSASVEFRLTLRLCMAALLGAGLGKERSIAKHSAGVRTMALVAMGASAFTICSIYGFNVFGNKHDPGRMASQVASGVGFVGAGVITSTSHLNGRNIVHGLTTAATIWLSAAVGVACGTGLFQVATAAAALTIFILRLGRVKPSDSPPKWSSTPQQYSGTKVASPKRAIPLELSAMPLDWQHSDDDDSFAETLDTAEWDEHHSTVQRILDDEMPPIIQEARRRIEQENHRLSTMVHDEKAPPARKSEPISKQHSEPTHIKIVVDQQDPEIVEIMQNAMKGNNASHHDMHIHNMQRFAHYAANHTIGKPP